MDKEDLFGFDDKPEYEVEAPEIEEIEEVAQEAAETVEETPGEVTETVTEAEAPAETPTQKDNFVPLAALIEEREKARAYREQLAELQRQQEAAAVAERRSMVPDPIEDPMGFRQHVLEEARQIFRWENLERSRAQAVETYGQEFVAEVATFIAEQEKSDPTLTERVLAASNPAEFCIALKKRHDAVHAIEADPDEYVRRRALELGLTQPVAAEIPTPAPKSVQPRSIVSAPSKGERKNTGFQDFFDAIDNKR